MAKQILIIDDEEDMQIFLQTLFAKHGYETISAINGEEALTHLENSQPDLITLDILMPKRSGLSFFHEIRKREHLKAVPVVVLSGVTRHNEFFGDDIEVGPTEFVEKPIEPEALLTIVNRMLEHIDA